MLFKDLTSNQDTLPRWSRLIRGLFSLFTSPCKGGLDNIYNTQKDMTSHKILPIVITLHVIDMLHLLINNFINLIH